MKIDDYLSWRKAYIDKADVRPEDEAIVPGEKAPDGKVDAGEWLYFFRSLDIPYPADSLKTLHGIDVLNGEHVSQNLKAAEVYYEDYNKYIAFIREDLIKYPEYYKGLSPEMITDRPEDILALAKKFPDSFAINSWLSDLARFDNVSDEFRLGVARHFLEQAKKAILTGKEGNLASFSFLLYNMALAEKVRGTCGKEMLDGVFSIMGENAKRPAKDRISGGANLFQLEFYLLAEMDLTSAQRQDGLKLFFSLEPEKIPSNRSLFLYLSYLTRTTNLPEKEILEICKTIKEGIVQGHPESIQNFDGTAMLFAFAYTNPNVSDDGAGKVLAMFNDLVGSLSQKQSKIEDFDSFRKDALLAMSMMTTFKSRPLFSPTARLNAMTDLFKTLCPGPDVTMFHTYEASNIFFGVARFLERDEFTAFFSAACDHLLSTPRPNTVGLAKTLAWIMNSIHDMDARDSDDLRALLKWRLSAKQISKDEYNKRIAHLDSSADMYRVGICNKLSARTKMLLIAFGGADLYTSTFLKLYDGFKISDRTIDPFLKELDDLSSAFPDQNVTTEFILTCASFDKFTTLFTLRPDYFLNHLRKILSEPDEKKLISNIFLLSDTMHTFFVDKNLGQYKGEIETYLLNAYMEKPAAGLGYLIRENQSDFSPANRQEADRLCAALPSVLPPVIPNSWVKDNVIRAKLFFYQEEHYALIQTMFRQRGFLVKSLPGKEGVEMTATINGVKIIVVASMDTDRAKVEEALNGDHYQIVSHRGHSYQLYETFPSSEDINPKGKLLILGSCGGFRSIPDLMSTYHGNYFIATEGMGVGQMNNEILYYLFNFMAQNKDAIGQDKVTFKQAREYVLGKVPKSYAETMVFPSDKGMLLFDFMAKYQASHGQPTP